MAYPLAYWALALPIAAVGGGGGGVLVVESHRLGSIASNHKTDPECPRFDRGTMVPLPRSLGACFKRCPCMIFYVLLRAGWTE